MLIWGFIFAGVAFGVLIACLIVAERELKEKNVRLQLLESRSDPRAGPEADETGDEEKVAVLEQKLDDAKGEKSLLLQQITDLERRCSDGQEKIHSLEEAQKRIPELEGKITGLEEEKSQLMTRLEALDQEQNGRREKVELLQGLEKRIPELERQIAGLEEEKSSLAGEIARLKKEREESQAKVSLLENLQAKLPEMERQIADLNEERVRLQKEIADLKSLILGKLEAPLAGLKELYQHLGSSTT